jgi:hypothetical protein
MEYGATARNRSVYASPPVGGSGFRFARPAAPPTLNSTHILPALVAYYGTMLRKTLLCPPKCHIQPERLWDSFAILAKASVHGDAFLNRVETFLAEPGGIRYLVLV